MDYDFRTYEKAFNDANGKARQATYDWVRMVISILTPSLVLLIGFQDSSEDLSVCTLAFLILSILSMAITILGGLYVLSSEARGNHLLRDEIATAQKQGKPLPRGVMLGNSYKHANNLFRWGTVLSILLLTAFGVSKYLS
jgi:hypothetical protein